MGLAGLVLAAFGTVAEPMAEAVGAQNDSQIPIDPQIAHEIAGIQAIDNHAHPVLAPPAMATDREFDALPADSLEPQTDPVALRPDYPLLGAAWKALYGFDTPPPLDAAGLAQLNALRAKVEADKGEHFPSWALDQAGIGTMLANRVALGYGIEPPRFRWVPFADALLFPLDNEGLAAATPDRKTFFPLEAIVRARYVKESGLSALPKTLDEYLKKVVTATLERHKAGGAVAEKFEVAHLRSFDFSDPARAAAAKVYARWIAGGQPDAGDYKLLQDFLFRYIAAECGRIGLPVHIHTLGGIGSYFSVAGVNPLLLEPLFNDARLRTTRFVLLHGGWPYVREIASLLQKPNVYADISCQDILFPPRTQAGWLREWLEFVPDKVLFGTDAYGFSEQMGWPEAAWIATHDARQALGIALTGMVADGEISRGRAGEIAHLVLHDNAQALYGFK
jgi:predicted TIM-barrel fold metal-dependent hydrolase